MLNYKSIIHYFTFIFLTLLSFTIKKQEVRNEGQYNINFTKTMFNTACSRQFHKIKFYTLEFLKRYRDSWNLSIVVMLPF